MTTEDFQETAHKSRGEAIGFHRGVGVCKAGLVGEESSVGKCLVLGRDSWSEIFWGFADTPRGGDVLVLYELLGRLEAKVVVHDAEAKIILDGVV